MSLETLCAVLCVVGIVIMFAATRVPASPPRAEPVPVGSWWPSAGPDTAVDAPWVRATPGALLAGQQAETAMRDLLLASLPAGSWVLSGLTLPGLAGDIDLLVVGALGAVVLEVKYWAGRIVCGPSGHAWARTRRGLVETPPLRHRVKRCTSRIALPVTGRAPKEMDRLLQH